MKLSKRLLVATFILLLPAFVFAAATATIAPNPKFRAMNSNGDPYVGAKLYTYATETTTPKTTWTDSTKATPNANPIILDSKGEADVWIDSTDGLYRFRLLDADDVTLWTKDGIMDVRGVREEFSITHNADGTQKGYRLVSEFDDLADAVSDLGSTPTNLIINENETVTENLVVPSTIILHFTHGSMVSISAGKTLTVYSPSHIIAARTQQIKTGAGTLAFSVGGEVYPNWWLTNTTPGTTDMTDAFQAASDSLVVASGGGNIQLLSQLYLSGPFTLGYKVNITGIAPQNFNELAANMPMQSGMKLKASSAAPLITTDNTNGYSRGASAIGVGNRLYQNSTIKNIAFDGNKDNQTSFDADIIRIFQSWNVTVESCSFLNSKGFGLRILDSNIVNILKNHMIAAPMFVESSADSLFFGNQIGGGNGDIWTPFWMADVGEACWQNIISNNFIFNNSNNVDSTSLTFTAAGAVITTSAPHGWADGTPVSLLTSASDLPSGLLVYRTYYVTSTGASTLKLSVSRAALAAGTYITTADAGTGTHTIRMGKSAGLYLSGGAGVMKWNTFSSNRFDQNYGSNILLDNADENTFVANIVNGAGMGNGTGQAGVMLQSTSDRNVFSGNTINGTVYASSVYTSNQDYGILDDGSTAHTKLSGNLIYNHATANISLTEYTTEDITDEVFISQKEFDAVSGSPVLGTIGGTRRPVILFDAAANEIIAAWFMVPKGWDSALPYLVWANAGAGAGDVVWTVQCLNVTAGETLNAVDSVGPSLMVSTAGAQDVVVELTGASSLSGLSEGYWMSLRVTRNANDVGDTLANDAGFIGIKLVRN